MKGSNCFRVPFFVTNDSDEVVFDCGTNETKALRFSFQPKDEGGRGDGCNALKTYNLGSNLGSRADLVWKPS